MTKVPDRRGARVAPALLAAWMAPATALALDSGWPDSGVGEVFGPFAVEPLQVGFAGPTDQVAFAADAGRVWLSYLPADRDSAAAGVVLVAHHDVSLDDLARVDPEVFEDLEIFTRPWLWEESCGQKIDGEPTGCGEREDRADRTDERGGGCGGGWSSTDTATPGVQGDTGDDGTGEISFSLGEYDGWILRDAAPADVLSRLADRGFAFPAGSEAAITEALEAGQALVALRLDPLETTSGWPVPSGIQIRGVGVDPVVPLRLGTLGGVDTRDLVVYGLHARAALVPRLEAAPGAGDCLVDTEAGLSLAMQAAWEAASGIPAAGSGPPVQAWEAWLPDGQCRDCRVYDHLPDSVPELLGGMSGTPALTRHRIRYARGAVGADPVIDAVESGTPPLGVRRILEHRWELEAAYASCDGAVPLHPGTCFTAAYWAERAQEPTYANEELHPAPRRLCGGRSRAALLLFPLVVLALRRRR